MTKRFKYKEDSVAVSSNLPQELLEKGYQNKKLYPIKLLNNDNSKGYFIVLNSRTMLKLQSQDGILTGWSQFFNLK